MFLLEKQHLKPVSKEIDIQTNYESSITRCIHKDNTIRYHSIRYSLPLGPYNKFEKVCIKETEDKQLIIYNPVTAEIIAKHSIPEGKGILIKDRKHSRDRTKGIDAFIETVAQRFEIKELAYQYLDILRENYPRYVKDQLHIILPETNDNTNEILSTALAECVKRKLFSATDFSDIVAYVKRQRRVHETVVEKGKEIKQLNKLSEWVMETEAFKRIVDTYTELLEGEYS